MSWIARAVGTIFIFAGIMLYVVVFGAALNPLWNIASSMPAVTNGPFWSVLQTYKWIATYAIPGILIVSGIVVWIVGQVREETNKYPTGPHP